ncbi:hypothetical protein GCM10017744_000590 [Streptomyces antimycoticus]
MTWLNAGSPFPDLTVDVAGRGRVSVREELAGDYGVVLIYRGSWCPYCNAQLRPSNGRGTPSRNSASR